MAGWTSHQPGWLNNNRNRCCQPMAMARNKICKECSQSKEVTGRLFRPEERCQSMDMTDSCPGYCQHQRALGITVQIIWTPDMSSSLSLWWWFEHNQAFTKCNLSVNADTSIGFGGIVQPFQVQRGTNLAAIEMQSFTICHLQATSHNGNSLQANGSELSPTCGGGSGKGNGYQNRVSYTDCR